MVVQTVEPPDTSYEIPNVNTKLDILQVAHKKTIAVDQGSENGNSILKSHIYEIRFRDDPNESFRGEILIQDPHLDDTIHTANIVCEITPDIRVVPARGNISVGQEAKFTIIVKEPLRTLTIEAEDGAESPFEIEQMDDSSTAHAATFSVKLKHDQNHNKIHNIIVSSPSYPSRKVVVPIRILGTIEKESE